MTRRRELGFVVLVLALSAALGIAGVTVLKHSEALRAGQSAGSTGDRGVAVSVATAAMTEVKFEVEASGFLEPYERLTISAEVPGYIAKQFVEVGDRVGKGDSVYQLDDALPSVALEKARAAAERARSELDLAEENLKRVEALDVQRSANPTEVLQFQTQFAIAQAMVKQADAFVVEAGILLEKTLIRSPINGEVSAIHRRGGEYTIASQPMIDVIETDRLKLIVMLNDREVTAFKRGDPASMETPALPGRVFTGTICRIHPQAALTSRKFEVEIEAANADQSLRPGFFVNAHLTRRVAAGDSADVPSVLTIPRMAVFEQYHQQFCYVVRASAGGDEHRAHQTRITTAAFQPDPTLIQVVTGLSPQDRVVSSGLQNVAHESIVRIVE